MKNRRAKHERKKRLQAAAARGADPLIDIQESNGDPAQKN
jgi:rRNA maturation protein Rpf1